MGISHALRTLAVVLIGAAPAAATPSASPFLDALDAMMVQLAPESARAGATIRRLYRDHLELLMLHEYAELETALGNGGVVPLPEEPARFNLRPRLDGANPIGEKDLDRQSSYVAARTAALGALIEIASRVGSGPVEVTSLVRHGEYQAALAKTNGNAITEVPMHALGLAFDIALVNTPLATVYELRDVLREMSRAGDILFVGERRQLVFHVVPHPSRIGHFSERFIAAAGLQPTSQYAHVTAPLPAAAGAPRTAGPQVTAEVVAMLPGLDPADLAALMPPSAHVSPSSADVRAPVPPDVEAGVQARLPAPGSGRVTWTAAGLAGGPWLMILAGVAATAMARRRPQRARRCDSRGRGCPGHSAP